MAAELHAIAIPDLPEATDGLDVGQAITDAIGRARFELQNGDVIVIAQKFVSKAEGAVVALAGVTPSTAAREWAAAHGRDPAVTEVVLRESRRIVRMTRDVIIAETRHGLVCANAGVDASNVAEGFVTVLPQNPDASAARVCHAIAAGLNRRIGVIISDTFGRPWREGAVNVAIGVAGVQPLLDYRGQADQFGRTLKSTMIAVADEIAAAAELVMRKVAATPAVIVCGAGEFLGDGTAATLIRRPEMDLFR
jgi:coenzyme F420-0:L-glutamate ligase/coenzyme F420-1:gamma-L-glutamate ligase